MIINDNKLPDLPPPASTVGFIGWLRKNLFSSGINSIITLVVGYLLFVNVAAVIDWAFLTSDWLGETRDDCTSGGACRVFISVRPHQFIYRPYPLLVKITATLYL